jgi:hypothetical protein
MMPGWDACTLEPNVAIRWIECHPSGTIAIATVLGLAGAALVPLFIWRQDHSQRKKELIQASESFAAALLVPFSAVRGDISRVRSMLDLLARKSSTDPAITTVMDECHLIVPTEVPLAMRELYRFDNSVVAPIRSSVTAVTAYNVSVDGFYRAAIANLSNYLDNKSKVHGVLNALLDVAETQLDRLVAPVTFK